jgi:glycosyltransferase involved in cell wall biosynthesis
VKLAVVVQRYGQGINGGAELHARYVAEHLTRHAEVEVLTTCATDYVSWRNELPAGVEKINGVPVRRFQVRHERDTLDFGKRSEHVFREPHSIADELGWLDAQGPTSTALVRYITRHAADYDFWFFFSYRYYHAYHGARAAGTRAVLVPTAERDDAIGLSIFPPLFRGVRAVMYNSPEERAMIQAAAGNEHVPSVVVGIGSEVPSNPQPGRFRQKFNIRGPFAIYVGRIDENKGCRELFEFFQSYVRTGATQLSLVLVGNSVLPIPSDPRIRHVGFLDDADKFDAMAAAELLIMPSYFESLSMVALEAWALSRPVLANAKCDVLKGQCIRSNGGLYYEHQSEFIETLRAMEQNRWLSVTLGKNGRQFFREQYDWPVIETKYLDLIARLSSPDTSRDEARGRQGIEPLPGWIARHRPDCPPASAVAGKLPGGAVLRSEAGAPVRPIVSPPPPEAPRGGADRRTFRSDRGPDRGRRPPPPQRAQRPGGA